MATLTVRERGRIPYTVDVSGELTIGREAGNDLVVADDQASRRHARLVIDAAGACSVVDLGSTHGTLVNGARAESARLRDGDVIQIGNVLLVFSATEASAPPLVQQAITASARPTPRRQDEDGRRLELLYEISHAIGALDEPEEMLARMLDATLELLDGERGVVGLAHGGVASGRRIARTRRGDPAEGEVVVSRTLIDAMLTRGQAIRVSAEMVQAPHSLVRAGVRAAIGAPLLIGARVLGFVYLDDRSRLLPFSPAELDFLVALSHLAAAALDQAEQRRRDRNVAESLREAHPAAEILGSSPAMMRLKHELGRYAATGAPVLVRGESGTGKELVANAIHTLSPRAGAPFVAVNCAAIPDSILESELFGHEKGSYTGAHKARRGKFALADGGTLFLDEIGELSAAAQAKVLRAIELGEITPVGAEASQTVDVRIVAATHRPLEADLAAGRFREDLFYRLNVAELEVPPLRLRGDDLDLLAETFRARAAHRLDRPNTGFSDAALAALRACPWPGNVRQLLNEIERAVILADGPLIDVQHLRVAVTGMATTAGAGVVTTPPASRPAPPAAPRRPWAPTCRPRRLHRRRPSPTVTASSTSTSAPSSRPRCAWPAGAPPRPPACSAWAGVC